MKIIGITGKSGSGKSIVCTELAKYGVYHIDTDKITHNIYETDSKLKKELADTFSAEIINDNKIDRKKLGEKVFNNSEKLNLLGKIVHPYVIQAVEKEIKKAEENGYEYVSVDAPALFESGYDKNCDIIIAVISDENFMIKRIVSRDNITEAAAKKRIAGQKPDSYYTQKADFVIDNTDALDDLKEKVLLLAAKIF